MEFKEVVGRRRSIRFYQSWRPVEREKIQAILEAARLSSRAVNADWAQAIVVYRNELSEDDRETLKTPTTAQHDLAPVWIVWLLDPTAATMWKDTLHQLVDAGALSPSHGWSHAYVDDVVYPQVLKPMSDSPTDSLQMAAIEAGQAMCLALLAAVDQGLGT